jgi:hypothetical protein
VKLLDTRDRTRRGWIRFAEGCVAFQVEALRSEEFAATELVDMEKSKRGKNPGFSDTLMGPGDDLLWDRWLDG